MWGYQEFRDDVREIWQPLFEGFGFHDVEHSDRRVVLNNGQCLLIVFIEDFTTNIKFIDPRNRIREYSLVTMLSSLGLIYRVESNNLPNDYRENIRQSLSNDLRFLLSSLTHVLAGDFIWTDDYIVQERYERKLFEKLWKLDADDPIYLKFTNGDLSWMVDLAKRKI